MKLQIGDIVIAVDSKGGGWGDVRKGNKGVIIKRGEMCLKYPGQRLWIARFVAQDYWQGIPSDYEIVKDGKRYKPEASIIKEKKERIRKILVGIKVHSKIMTEKRANSRRDEHNARGYLLGADKKHVIQGIVRLPRWGGCHNLAGATAAHIAMASRKLYEKNLIPIGFLRLGVSINSDSDYLNHITHLSKNIVMLTCADDVMRGEMWSSTGRKFLQYNVVK